MTKGIKRISDWWDGLNSFSQFWLFWFGVALVGIPICLIISELVGGGE